MKLNQKLRRIREEGESKRPPEYTRVMKRATEELRASGAAERALGVGDEAPLFKLPRIGGGSLELGFMLEQSPVVVSFFRGRW